MKQFMIHVRLFDKNTLRNLQRKLEIDLEDAEKDESCDFYNLEAGNKGKRMKK